jgi:P27 family predicted phage terminase small subunit
LHPIGRRMIEISIRLFLFSLMILNKMAKTDDEKKLQGTLRDDRKKGESNVKDLLLTRVQSLPAFIRDNITDNQFNIYQHTLRLLISAKVVTKLDLAVVAQYAIAFDVYMAATNELNMFGRVQVFQKTGATNVSGYFTVWKQAQEELAKKERLLGLNPYIRERMASYAASDANEEESAFEALARELRTDNE